MNKRVVLTLLIVLILTVFGFKGAVANARVINVDFGDFNDYDSGSDWGGDFDFDDLDFDFGSNGDYYDDWDWHIFSGGYGADDGTSIGFRFFAGAVIIFIIVVIAIGKSKGGFSAGKGYKRASHRKTGAYNDIPRKPWQILPDRTSEIEQIIKDRDPAFSSADLATFVKNSFVAIQMGWANRDLSDVRGVLANNLYEQTNQQIKRKIEDHVINKIENVCVNTTYLSGYRMEGGFEYLTLYLSAKMIDYQINEDTGELLRGDRETRWELYYKIKLMRSTNVLTGENTFKAMNHQCPNCGAPLHFSASGTCEFCGSYVTSGQYGWVICDIGTIGSDTVDDGIRR